MVREVYPEVEQDLPVPVAQESTVGSQAKGKDEQKKYTVGNSIHEKLKTSRENVVNFCWGKSFPNVTSR